MDTAHTQPRVLNLPDRARLVKALNAAGLNGLRLPGVTPHTPPCLGHQFGHNCPKCCPGKPTTVAPGDKPQPWQPRAARRAA